MDNSSQQADSQSTSVDMALFYTDQLNRTGSLCHDDSNIIEYYLHIYFPP